MTAKRIPVSILMSIRFSLSFLRNILAPLGLVSAIQLYFLIFSKAVSISAEKTSFTSTLPFLYTYAPSASSFSISCLPVSGDDVTDIFTLSSGGL